MGFPHVPRTAEIEQSILDGIAAGTPLAILCRRLGFSRDVVYDWQRGPENENFKQRIADARAVGFDAIADEAFEIADTPEVGSETTTKADGTIEMKHGDMLGHRKLRIETRLKLLAKWDPRRYGDRQQVEHSGSLSLEQLVTNSFKKPE